MTDCDGLITDLRNANNAARIDLEAIKARRKCRCGHLARRDHVDGTGRCTEDNDRDWYCACPGFTPADLDLDALVAEVERLHEREAALIRVKDADLDDVRDEVEFLKAEDYRHRAEVERLRAIVQVVELVAQSDGVYAAEIAGVRIERCDEFGKTATTIDLEQTRLDLAAVLTTASYLANP